MIRGDVRGKFIGYRTWYPEYHKREFLLIGTTPVFGLIAAVVVSQQLQGTP